MERAKKRNGIPLDLIQPRGSIPHTPKQPQKSNAKDPLSIKNQLNSQWKKVNKHPKNMSLQPDNNTSQKSFAVRWRPIQSDTKELRSGANRSESAEWRETQQPKENLIDEDDDFKLEWSSIQSKNDRETLRSTRRNPTLLQRNLPREPAGLHERLVKTYTEPIKQPTNPHFLKVAVIGAANAGKSTLVNKCVGEEISVVSPKSHTTRDRVLAVLTENEYQVAFLDTPGVIPDNKHANMDRTLATSSWRSLDEADHALILVDADMALSPRGLETETFLLQRLKSWRIPATLVFNKMDLVGYKHTVLRDVTLRYRIAYPFIKRAVYISALENIELDKLKRTLFNAALPKPWEYPGEQKQEMPDLKRVEELIRVEFFKRLHQYIPYMLKQENVGWTELSDGTLRIDQNIYVERDSQHKIVVGANGRVVNEVVECARLNISRAFRRPIRLFIQVKTKKN